MKIQYENIRKPFLSLILPFLLLITVCRESEERGRLLCARCYRDFGRWVILSFGFRDARDVAFLEGILYFGDIANGHIKRD